MGGGGCRERAWQEGGRSYLRVGGGGGGGWGMIPPVIITRNRHVAKRGPRPVDQPERDQVRRLSVGMRVEGDWPAEVAASAPEGAWWDHDAAAAGVSTCVDWAAADGPGTGYGGRGLEFCGVRPDLAI